MTTGEHELPPHLARYLDSLSEPTAAADAPRLTITAGYDADQYLTGRAAPVAAAPRRSPGRVRGLRLPSRRTGTSTRAQPPGGTRHKRNWPP